MSSNPFEEINSRLSNIELMLLDIKHKPDKTQSPQETDEILTVQETAKFLKLSVQTVYGMIHEKTINYMKVAKRVYFLKSDLVSFLKNSRTKTRREIIKESEVSTIKKG